jgi:molybdenum cofactor biosynthesis enzyme MoaA
LTEGYRAMLDAKNWGCHAMALIHISMDKTHPERFATFESEVTVLRCWSAFDHWPRR